MAFRLSVIWCEQFVKFLSNNCLMHLSINCVINFCNRKWLLNTKNFFFCLLFLFVFFLFLWFSVLKEIFDQIIDFWISYTEQSMFSWKKKTVCFLIFDSTFNFFNYHYCLYPLFTKLFNIFLFNKLLYKKKFFIAFNRSLFVKQKILIYFLILSDEILLYFSVKQSQKKKRTTFIVVVINTVKNFWLYW